MFSLRKLKQIEHLLLDGKIQSIIIMVLFAILILIMGVNLTLKNNVNPKDIVMYQMDEKPKKLPLDIYFTKEFNNNDLEATVKAIEKWNKASNGVANISAHFYWEPPCPFSKNVYKTFPLTTVWKKPSNDIALNELQLSHGFMDVAYDSNFLIIIDTPYNKAHSQMVFEHMFGHLFGLEDLKKEYMGVMYIGGNNGEITKYDMKEFCYLYNSDCAKNKLRF